MVYKVAQAVLLLSVVINCGVDEFLQVLQPRFGFIGVLRLERVRITRVENRRLDDIRDGRSVCPGIVGRMTRFVMMF